MPLLPLALLWTAITGRWDAGVILGVATFLCYRLFVVQWVFLAAHRRGIRETRAGEYAWALESFRDSQRYFEERPALDRYRTVLMASGMAYPYRELARYNQAYCLAHLGRRQEAEVLLAELLQAHPRMGVARELLRALEGTEEAPGQGEGWFEE